MTRATWCAAAGDRGRAYRGAHRATRPGPLVTRVLRLLHPLVTVGALLAGLLLGLAELLPDRWWSAPLPLAILLGAGWWAVVVMAALVGGLWWAIGAAVVGVWLLLGGLAVPSGWWRR